MVLLKVLLYLALLLGAFLLISFVVSAVLTALSLLWTLLTTAIGVAALVALAYGGYRLYTLLSAGESTGQQAASEGSQSQDHHSSPATDDPVESIQNAYTDGRISEAELERRLEQEFDGPETDSIDRELQRDRR